MAKHMRRGKMKVLLATTVAGYNALNGTGSPTAGEISGAIDLSPYISAMEGFDVTVQYIDTPVLSSTFVPKISGGEQLGDPSISFYDEDNAGTAAIRTALASGTNAYIIKAPYGLVAAKRLETWAVTSSGPNDMVDLGQVAAQFKVGFSVPSVPSLNGVHP